MTSNLSLRKPNLLSETKSDSCAGLHGYCQVTVRVPVRAKLLKSLQLSVLSALTVRCQKGMCQVSGLRGGTLVPLTD